MGKLQTIGRIIDTANRVLPDDVKREMAEQTKKVIKQVTPTPEEVARDIDHAATRMREKAPAAMEQVSHAANKALDVAKEFAPSVVRRASSIVDAARDGAHIHAGEDRTENQVNTAYPDEKAEKGTNHDA